MYGARFPFKFIVSGPRASLTSSYSSNRFCVIICTEGHSCAFIIIPVVANSTCDEFGRCLLTDLTDVMRVTISKIDGYVSHHEANDTYPLAWDYPRALFSTHSCTRRFKPKSQQDGGLLGRSRLL